MNFDLPTEATDAAGLAATILADHCTPARLREVDALEERIDRSLWAALGEAGLLGLAVPEDAGGAGLGLLEVAAVLVEAGRAVAPVPIGTHAVAAMTLAEVGDSHVRETWLPRAASGEALLTAAVDRDRAGSFSVVQAGTAADAFVLPTPDRSGLVLLTPDAPGVRIEPQRITDGDLAARITVDADAFDDRPTLGGPEAVDRLADRLAVAEVAHQVGVVDGALALTAQYARSREQFGRPIGTFQAVSQRLADGYIDVLGARLVLWQAAWRLSESLPATVEIAAARMWAADAGHRLAHTAVHVHGGVGIDLDGETHRYFTAAKCSEFLLGGSTAAARRIGAELAASGA
ncbi:acyl-CoA dehydrogenase family protein [Nocardioides terrisoli]|uniref:acyl-CoA dehydrogenase family protein n=1 Tax=Nocardioides terrisoli TaxID=3388267 RepID=UPI00287BB3D4|nr:acyl-CoA dehydrogenase family protein [Nocardioides marmorisolisilvae]